MLCYTSNLSDRRWLISCKSNAPLLSMGVLDVNNSPNKKNNRLSGSRLIFYKTNKFYISNWLFFPASAFLQIKRCFFKGVLCYK